MAANVSAAATFALDLKLLGSLASNAKQLHLGQAGNLQLIQFVVGTTKQQQLILQQQNISQVVAQVAQHQPQETNQLLPQQEPVKPQLQPQPSLATEHQSHNQHQLQVVQQQQQLPQQKQEVHQQQQLPQQKQEVHQQRDVVSHQQELQQPMQKPVQQPAQQQPQLQSLSQEKVPPANRNHAQLSERDDLDPKVGTSPPVPTAENDSRKRKRLSKSPSPATSTSTCTICSKTFSDKLEFNAHIKMHLRQKIDARRRGDEKEKTAEVPKKKAKGEEDVQVTKAGLSIPPTYSQVMAELAACKPIPPKQVVEAANAGHAMPALTQPKDERLTAPTSNATPEVSDLDDDDSSLISAAATAASSHDQDMINSVLDQIEKALSPPLAGKASVLPDTPPDSDSENNNAKTQSSPVDLELPMSSINDSSGFQSGPGIDLLGLDKFILPQVHYLPNTEFSSVTFDGPSCPNSSKSAEENSREVTEARQGAVAILGAVPEKATDTCVQQHAPVAFPNGSSSRSTDAVVNWQQQQAALVVDNSTVTGCEGRSFVFKSSSFADDDDKESAHEKQGNRKNEFASVTLPPVVPRLISLPTTPLPISEAIATDTTVAEKRKPHLCLTCGKSFTQKGHLNRHEKTHHTPNKTQSSSSSSLQCTVCGKLCKNKLSLARHKSKHLPPSKFAAVGAKDDQQRDIKSEPKQPPLEMASPEKAPAPAPLPPLSMPIFATTAVPRGDSFLVSAADEDDTDEANHVDAANEPGKDGQSLADIADSNFFQFDDLNGDSDIYPREFF